MDILDEAGMAERFMPKPKTPKAASMYDILETSYAPGEHGYYNDKKLKLRANNKQINCWDLTITELLPLVELEERQILWQRSKRYSWVALGKMFNCHRVTIKKKYINAVFNLEKKLSKSLIDKIDKI
ncbi:hypothetical protein N9503_04355 [Candidatus Pelagibacter sp.]|nr:hypothetical protein [Candidatus Pelagibacter sp.]